MSSIRRCISNLLHIKSILVLIVVAASVAFPIMTCNSYGKSSYYETSHPMETGNRYLQMMEPENAVTAFETAIRKDPLNTEAYLKLADTYAVLKKPEEAIRILQNGYIVTGEECLQAEAEMLSGENDSQETVPETE